MEDSKYNPIEYDNYTLFEFILQTVKFQKSVLDNPFIWENFDLDETIN